MNEQDIEKIVESLNTGKQKYLLTFNKISGSYVGMIGYYNNEKPSLNYDHFIYKEVELDPSKETWVGNYKTGKVIPLEEFKPEINEYMINAGCKAKINRNYPIYKQLNIIIDLLDKIVNDNDLKGKEADNFKRMVLFLKETKEINKRYKQAYKESDIVFYRSKDEMYKKYSKQVDGGVREYIRRPGSKSDQEFA